MKVKKQFILALGVLAAVIIFKKRKVIKETVLAAKDSFDKFVILADLIPKFEGFSPNPFWDYKQWSWGYGTAAGVDKSKKPAGTISKPKAMVDAILHLRENFKVLDKAVKVPLNGRQWASLLSFSYNLGIGNALKLVPNINTKSAVLENQFKSYCFAGGLKDPGLVKRRITEWDLWSS